MRSQKEKKLSEKTPAHKHCLLEPTLDAAMCLFSDALPKILSTVSVRIQFLKEIIILVLESIKSLQLHGPNIDSHNQNKFIFGKLDKVYNKLSEWFLKHAGSSFGRADDRYYFDKDSTVKEIEVLTYGVH